MIRQAGYDRSGKPMKRNLHRGALAGWKIGKMVIAKPANLSPRALMAHYPRLNSGDFFIKRLTFPLVINNNARHALRKSPSSELYRRD